MSPIPHSLNGNGDMNRRLQLAGVWAGPAFVVLYGLAFVAIAQFIPPPAPSWDAAHIDHIFADRAIPIRIGMVLSLIFATLLFPFFGVISVQIARIERGGRTLAIMQYGAAVLLIVFFELCSMLWVTATFRSELDPAVTRMLSDLGWLSFVMVFPGYVLQLSCIGIAALMDRSPDPVWPRWVAYLNFWCAMGGAGGAVAVFFKEGPFAWNGLVGFYIPVGMFLMWIAVMAYYTHTGINRQFANGEQLEPAERMAERNPVRA